MSKDFALHKSWRLTIVAWIAKIFRIKFNYWGFPYGAKFDPFMDTPKNPLWLDPDEPSSSSDTDDE